MGPIEIMHLFVVASYCIYFVIGYHLSGSVCMVKLSKMLYRHLIYLLNFLNL